MFHYLPSFEVPCPCNLYLMIQMKNKRGEEGVAVQDCENMRQFEATASRGMGAAAP